MDAPSYHRLQHRTLPRYLCQLPLWGVGFALVIFAPPSLKLISGAILALAAIGLIKERGPSVRLDANGIQITGIVSLQTGYKKIESVQSPRRHLPPRLGRVYQKLLLFIPPSIDTYGPNIELVLREPLWVFVPFPPPFLFKKRVFELALEDPTAFDRELIQRRQGLPQGRTDLRARHG